MVSPVYILQHYVNEATSALVDEKLSFCVHFDQRLVDAFLLSFGQLPTPWPLDVRGTSEQAAFCLENFEAPCSDDWTAMEVRPLLRLVLAGLLDWYYTDAVLVPDKPPMQLIDVLQHIIDIGGPTDQTVACQLRLVHSMGWCAQLLPEGAGWFFILDRRFEKCVVDFSRRCGQRSMSDGTPRFIQ